MNGSANGTRTRISALRGPRANLCTIAPTFEYYRVLDFSAIVVTVARENFMTRLLIEGLKAGLIASSVRQHTEVRQAKGALTRLGKQLACGPKRHGDLLERTLRGQGSGDFLSSPHTGSR
jgi:hypothetical protein